MLLAYLPGIRGQWDLSLHLEKCPLGCVCPTSLAVLYCALHLKYTWDWPQEQLFVTNWNYFTKSSEDYVLKITYCSPFSKWFFLVVGKLSSKLQKVRDGAIYTLNLLLSKRKMKSETVCRVPETISLVVFPLLLNFTCIWKTWGSICPQKIS